MNTTSKSSPCPKCGAPLDAGACPRCLMLAAMQPTEGAERQPAPTLAEVSAAFPHLEILSLIGQGGMGCVFKVRQPKLDRIAALKLLPASLAERDAAFAGRFEREGQLLARLHHPNIVAVHDSGVAGPFFYLLMEFVDGVNLRQAMRSSRFTPAQALAIVPHICDALQFAHDEGVLHRDIKPENILLDAKGRVKLADFGIAKLLGDPPDRTDRTELTQHGTTLGTPSYMAPEQRDTPADVDNRADIYSLGVVFYELLTGELPTGSIAQPSAKCDADPRVDAIVQQALEKERTRRQSSASEVKTQIDGISKSEPRSSSPTSPARLSKTALIGAIWAFGGIVHFLFPTLGYRLRSEFIPYTMMAIGWSALIGATILGWVAFKKIRRSAGSLRGVGLALFAGLYVPLIIVAALIAGALRTIGYGLLNWSQISSSMLKTQFTFVLCVLSILAWIFIIRAASRRLCPSPQLEEKPAHPLRPTLLLQAALFAALTALMLFTLPKFDQIFADMGTAVPSLTQHFFQTARIWGLMLFPLLLIVGASGCFFARELGGKRGLRQWSIAVIVGLVSVVAMSSVALWLPMQKLVTELGAGMEPSFYDWGKNGYWVLDVEESRQLSNTPPATKLLHEFIGTGNGKAKGGTKQSLTVARNQVIWRTEGGKLLTPIQPIGTTPAAIDLNLTFKDETISWNVRLSRQDANRLLVAPMEADPQTFVTAPRFTLVFKRSSSTSAEKFRDATNEKEQIEADQKKAALHKKFPDFSTPQGAVFAYHDALERLDIEAVLASVSAERLAIAASPNGYARELIDAEKLHKVIKEDCSTLISIGEPKFDPAKGVATLDYQKEIVGKNNSVLSSWEKCVKEGTEWRVWPDEQPTAQKPTQRFLEWAQGEWTLDRDESERATATLYPGNADNSPGTAALRAVFKPAIVAHHARFQPEVFEFWGVSESSNPPASDLPNTVGFMSSPMPKPAENASQNQLAVTLRMKAAGAPSALSIELNSVFSKAKDGLLQWTMEKPDGVKYVLVFRRIAPNAVSVPKLER